MGAFFGHIRESTRLLLRKREGEVPEFFAEFCRDQRIYRQNANSGDGSAGLTGA